ncbi:DUF2853 family protein [Paracoccus alkenifer]|uniref:DUF2853 domain-containing protein n=1 Tax=Paracoccus alkenifer TaxID=65735 RepID=A0A1H6K618_9RHOB|nr:DUF2853 family protein [Paracoccus alkenifer]SEH70647.1 Protein of unknown function [Paracoccus alkenifer]
MGRREELIEKYAGDLRNLGIQPDMALLEKATEACGPSIYLADASTVASSDPQEMERVRENFCKKKLGATDEARIDAALKKAVETYGSANRNKHRAVMYYLLAQELGGL